HVPDEPLQKGRIVRLRWCLFLQESFEELAEVASPPLFAHLGEPVAPFLVCPSPWVVRRSTAPGRGIDEYQARSHLRVGGGEQGGEARSFQPGDQDRLPGSHVLHH